MNDLVLLETRKIIFDNFNELDIRFNSDQILEFLKKNNNFDQSITVNDLESEFKKMEGDGLVRCIAQNFITKWFKLYDNVEKLNCNSCKNDIFLGKNESRICPDPKCAAPI